MHFYEQQQKTKQRLMFFPSSPSSFCPGYINSLAALFLVQEKESWPANGINSGRMACTRSVCVCRWNGMECRARTMSSTAQGSLIPGPCCSCKSPPTYLTDCNSHVMLRISIMLHYVGLPFPYNCTFGTKLMPCFQLNLCSNFAPSTANQPANQHVSQH